MPTGRADIQLSDFGLDPAGKRARLKRIGLVVLSAWKAKVAGHSPKIRSAYIKALTVVQDDNSVSVIFGQQGEADVKLALMVEFGMGPGGIGTEGAYDVRKYLLSGSGKGKLRTGRHGPYKVVPFSHTMVDIAKVGGKSLADQVKSDQFRASVSAGEHKTSWGDTIKANDLPGPVRPENQQKVDVAGNTYTASRHKAHPLAGLSKHASSYSRGVSQTSGGRTFRTASWAGDPWMHPGIRARHYGELVRRDLDKLLDGLI